MAFEVGGARNKNIKNVLILYGDQLYTMDYMDLVQSHIDRNSDITVSCVPVGESKWTPKSLDYLKKMHQVTLTLHPWEFRCLR
ncbi:glucose-1-phosphate adenylyltransferase large subunit 1 isoform X2 [Spinacia oleracea]|uniref:Glucose-1-phosphate adenylyltransferase large subunit 1 isoform X2 n=1 Tax=Spinacia oleracea TaxID=3562 RepID=A0ABM3RH91_SPIOL|nr:glucose-1-phosphate adenylyltransferase large subunit 1-like isoform X2 [Spinacia oleracea]